MTAFQISIKQMPVQFDISMIQQKKINTNYSLNFLEINHHGLVNEKNSQKRKKLEKQANKKLSISNLSNSKPINIELIKQSMKNEKFKTKIQRKSSLKNNLQNFLWQQKQRKSINVNNSKVNKVNNSNSAIYISQQNPNRKVSQSQNKRKSLCKFQVSNIQIQKGIQAKEKQQKTLKNINKQSKAEQTKKNYSSTKMNIFSNTKNKNNTRLNQYEHKKHLSCVSLLEGKLQNKSRSKSKSCSKSKSKSKNSDQKKNKKIPKKKQSYKFCQLKISNKPQYNKPSQNSLVKDSIQRQFRSISKKLAQQINRQRQKSLKLNYINQSKAKRNIQKKTGKQNKDPKKRYSSKSEKLIFLGKNQQVKKQVKYVIKKSGHPTKKGKLSLTEQNQNIIEENNHFLVKKQETPSTSRRQFPISKYFQCEKKRQKRQEGRRGSFQKTVKASKKKSSFYQRQLVNSRQKQSIHNQDLIIHIKKKQQKRPKKQKNNKNGQTMYVWEDTLYEQKQQIISSNLSNDLIYRQESIQQDQQKYKYDHTPKQYQRQKQDDKETILRKRSQFQSINDQFFKSVQGQTPVQYNTQKSKQSKTYFEHYDSSINKSLNLQQIRFYQSLSPLYNAEYQSKQNELKFQNKQIFQSKQQPIIFYNYYQSRQKIINELKQVYPLLTKKQLQFLSSVCFIQRKWRERTLAKKIKNLIQMNNKSELLINYQASNHSKKNILFDINSSNAQNSLTFFNKSQLRNLTTQSQNTQTQELASFQTQQNVSQLFFKKDHPRMFQEVNEKQIKDKIKQQISDKKQVEEKQHIKQLKSAQEEIQSRLATSVLHEEDIFPDVSYLKVKKYLLKKEFIEKVNSLRLKFKNKHILKQDFLKIKNQEEILYKQSLKQIHQTKKKLKKGYLKYIQTLNSVNKILILDNQQKKKIKQSNSQKHLKRVNSSQGFIGQIYNKIFKIDQISSENSSQLSGQTKRLDQIFLIRKLNESHPYRFPNKNMRTFKGIGQNLGSQDDYTMLTERHSTKLQTDDNFKNVISFSSRESKSMQLSTFNQFSKDENFLMSNKVQQSFRAEKIEEIKSQRQIEQLYKQRSQQLESPRLKQRYIQQQNQLQARSYNISELVSLQQNLQSKKYPQKLSEEFTRELQEYASCNQKQLYVPSRKRFQKQILIDKDEVVFKSFKIEQIDASIDDMEFIMQNEMSEEGSFRQQKEESLNSLDNQNYNALNKYNFNQQDQRNYHHVDYQEYNEQLPENISPVTSVIGSSTANIQAIEYLNKFIQYLKNSQYWRQFIYQNLNKPQGFSPLAYLKFIREYQLPEQCYVPIIPNQAFVQWEDKLAQQNDYEDLHFDQDQTTEFNQQKNQNSFNRLKFKSIQHRCLYEHLNSELESFRKYGQKGKPFPWEISYVYSDIPQIQESKIDKIFEKSILNIKQNHLKFSCGIILENHPQILDQQQLEALHDKNEDHIIDMLEAELNQQKNIWYEFEEHSLELKLQIGEQIWYELIKEMEWQISQLRNPINRLP